MNNIFLGLGKDPFTHWSLHSLIHTQQVGNREHLEIVQRFASGISLTCTAFLEYPSRWGLIISRQLEKLTTLKIMLLIFVTSHLGKGFEKTNFKDIQQELMPKYLIIYA